jgi:hypothetical protein
MYLTWLGIGLRLLRPVHDHVLVDGNLSRGSIESEDFVVEMLNGEP